MSNRRAIQFALVVFCLAMLVVRNMGQFAGGGVAPGARTAIVVEESGDRPTWLATIILSEDVRQYCEAKGHTFRAIDHDETSEQTKPYADAAEGDVPALVVGKANYGEVIKVTPMPKNVADTIQAIKSAGG